MTLRKLLLFCFVGGLAIGLAGRFSAEAGIIATVLVILAIFVMDRLAGWRGRHR